MSNIAQRLADQARARPDAPAIICPNGRRITFAELDSWSDRIARGLTDFGIGRGARCVLMVPPSPELFALCFGLFRAGAVPVMVDPGMGVGNLGRCLAEAEPHAFA
ncbi:MAG: AMP-binding protein, partial [Planctomycetota bacterium]|nr:AMP-binding protein [Planctomycetota bacterium]